MSTDFDLNVFTKTAEKILQKAKDEGRVIYNPSDDQLRELVAKEAGVQKTIYNNFVAPSEPSSRAQAFTKNSVDQQFGNDEIDLLKQCEDVLSEEKLICMDRIVGGKNSGTIVRLIVPQKFAHIAYGGGHLFYPTDGNDNKPDYQIVYFNDEQWELNKSKVLPDKDITIRLALLNDGGAVKIVRNSNYIGEYKKGVFACEDWAAKTKKGGIFLHCGAREDRLQMADGAFNTVSTLMCALSANGKTTTTCKILAKTEKELSWLVQDDGGTLMPDGSFRGFEGGGIFVKTEGVIPSEQVEIYYSLLQKDTVCENVFVDNDGDFDFNDVSLTANGRAVVRRDNIMHASPHIDIDKVDNLILITRAPIVPAISKMTLQQAAACMVLGQAMESSAGDPTKAGKIRNEFFYDPFVAGDRADHANQFYAILKGLPDINYYLINTGGVGEDANYKKIGVAETMGILEQLIRGDFKEWIDSPTGFKVPASLGDIDDTLVHPERLYTDAEFIEKRDELNTIRIEALKKIGDTLHEEIKNVFK
ncbi:MAG: phosphoenolpyruvate carboxykinase [Chloroflexi bacterium]|jgi:phosphoenolpyruvate carboxykinase (ATP)|nr:phosphoenolpyruvate carboxykinase [Chloroflexota bacterium]MBT7080180.1 phosphoenolpyruvate carboxykinase [Chloroflexota bacterium]MBT7289089.1 phosphoenolpyruvate carboxykinase [Chloroflexota bacterium]